MEKNDIYYFHQTPNDLAKDLIQTLNISNTDKLYEPFRGEGAFFNNFPTINTKIWSEIVDGINYTDITEDYDWVITNPPFKLDFEIGRANSFWFLLKYFADRAKKGIAFLANDRCFGTLTPTRIAYMNEKGWFLSNITVCSVKKWRGRYFFLVFTKTPSTFYKCLKNTY